MLGPFHQGCSTLLRRERQRKAQIRDNLIPIAPCLREQISATPVEFGQPVGMTGSFGFGDCLRHDGKRCIYRAFKPKDLRLHVEIDRKVDHGPELLQCGEATVEHCVSASKIVSMRFGPSTEKQRQSRQRFHLVPVREIPDPFGNVGETFKVLAIEGRHGFGVERMRLACGVPDVVDEADHLGECRIRCIGLASQPK